MLVSLVTGVATHTRPTHQRIMTIRYQNWTCVDKVTVEDEDEDGQAEVSSYHGICLSLDPVLFGDSVANVTVPFVWSANGSMFANVDAQTCRSRNDVAADPEDAAGLQTNISIGEAVWGRFQTPDEVGPV